MLSSPAQVVSLATKAGGSAWIPPGDLMGRLILGRFGKLMIANCFSRTDYCRRHKLTPAREERRVRHFLPPLE
jgi:hypothetical protein